MSSDDASEKECPLCMEAFDIDDINFFPCSCQYQICRFCWHRIRTNENGLCPACRQSYPEDPVNFQPLSNAELQRIKTEKKQKVQQQKTKLIEGRKHLSEFRVLQKNLVYAVGISHRMADPELLKKPEFFGKFGKIIKVAVGTAQAINNSTPPTHTAYVTYARCEDALRAIQAVNNMVVDGRLLKASLGTTKYCSNFLKGQACYKPECMYLHEVADDEISFTKEDMHQGKHTDYERRLLEQMFSILGMQQNSSTNLRQPNGPSREMLLTRSLINRATTAGMGEQQEMDKKRSTVGSAENLSRASSQQKQKKKCLNGGAIIWEDQKIPRRASETRELRRNESAKTITRPDVKRASKTSLKSASPLTISNGINAPSRVGSSNPSSGSSNAADSLRNTSPVSLSFPVGDEQIAAAVDERPVSDPPILATSASSSSPPPPFDTNTLANLLPTALNGILPTTQTDKIADQQHSLLDNNNCEQLSPTAALLPSAQASNSSTINFFLDHDDDLGFDPFAESAKALEEIMAEEKQKCLPEAAASNVENGNGRTDGCFFPTSNSLFNRQQQQLQHSNQAPPRLNPQHGVGFAPMNHGGLMERQSLGAVGNNNNRMITNDMTNSMSDLRESFKAMLPNVNVRFVSGMENDGSNHHPQQQQHAPHQTAAAAAANYFTHHPQQQQQQQNNMGFFGSIGTHSSTSSLPAALPGAVNGGAALPNHFRPFPSPLDAQQQQMRVPPPIPPPHFQQQQNQHQGSGRITTSTGLPTPQSPFHYPAMGQIFSNSAANNFGSGRSSLGSANSAFTNGGAAFFQQHQQQQQNHIGGHNMPSMHQQSPLPYAQQHSNNNGSCAAFIGGGESMNGGGGGGGSHFPVQPSIMQHFRQQQQQSTPGLQQHQQQHQGPPVSAADLYPATASSASVASEQNNASGWLSVPPGFSPRTTGSGF